MTKNRHLGQETATVDRRSRVRGKTDAAFLGCGSMHDIVGSICSTPKPPFARRNMAAVLAAHNLARPKQATQVQATLCS